MRIRRLLCVIFVAPLFSVVAQDREFLVRVFESAGREFNVPADVLKSIAFTETRWQQLTWDDADTASCMGMPRPYGIMALWNNGVFGHSLVDGAALIGQSVDVVRRDPVQNIRAAAVLLRRAYDGHGKHPEPFNDSFVDAPGWADAIAAYCGIRQPEIAYAHGYEVLFRLTRGYRDEHIDLPARSLELSAARIRLRELNELAKPVDPQKTTGTPDYPLASWLPGKAGYYYTTGNGKQFVVIHDMEGYYASVLSYFQTLNDGRSVSIHYCVNGLQDSPSDYPPGDITQMVEEQFYAWHAVCLNTYSIGIEHEGFAGNPAWFTPEMYLASARMTKYLCEKYGIPKDRNHIVGHGEWKNSAWVGWAVSNGYPSTFGTCNSHTDPGPFWDWAFYLQIVNDDSTPPNVTSVPPSSDLDVDASVSISFSQRMEPVSTGGAFHISPNVAGSIAWENNGRRLVFTPTAYLPFDSTFTVSIDGTARNYLNVGLDVNGDSIGGDVYSFDIRTVSRDSIPPSIVWTYPTDGEPAISRWVEFIVTFDEQIDQSTLASGFELETSDGIPLSVSAIDYSTGTGYSRVRFRTTAELPAGQLFRFVVLPSLKDLSGNPLTAGMSVDFTTEAAMTVSGTVINTLDAVGSWWQPSTSGSTHGVEASFALTSSIKHSGTASGQVNYRWTQTSGGVLREHNSSTPVIEGGTSLAAWVYGDKSGHDLRFGCYYYTGTGTSNFSVVSMGPIAWTGWKLKSIPLSSVPVGNGSPRKFSSFMVYQVAGGEMSGTLYFDDLTIVSSVSDVTDQNGNIIPESWSLNQNYPNPFNPSTTIEYDVPVRGHVRVAIWNAIGQRVRTIVDEEMAPGRYKGTFETGDLPAGVYFARLTAGPFNKTVKMVLLK